MTSKDEKPKLNPVIYEEAADWIVELREGEVDAAMREKLDAWFRTSPEHIRAYLELAAIWEEGADPDLDKGHETESLLALVRSSSNVVDLNTTAKNVPASQRDDLVVGAATHALQRSESHLVVNPTRRRRAWRRAWLSVGTAICTICVIGVYLYNQRNLTFATEIGEQRFEKLIDGSTIELNSRSKVRIRFSGNERNVDLLEGQALFHVAKDPSRPFIVYSDSTLVRAVGTQFDVYRRASGTTVTVVEGRVAVLSPMLEAERRQSESDSAVAPQVSITSHSTRSSQLEETPPAASAAGPVKNADSASQADPMLSNVRDAIYLAAGEQITVSSQSPARPMHTDPTVATAWTQHELIFDSTPLNEVAQEFNRYNTRQLVIRDGALRDFHITGVFSSADPASLLRFLRTQRDIVVDETDDDIRVSKK